MVITSNYELLLLTDQHLLNNANMG